jgi:hypothetical protein
VRGTSLVLGGGHSDVLPVSRGTVSFVEVAQTNDWGDRSVRRLELRLCVRNIFEKATRSDIFQV